MKSHLHSVRRWWILCAHTPSLVYTRSIRILGESSNENVSVLNTTTCWVDRWNAIERGKYGMDSLRENWERWSPALLNTWTRKLSHNTITRSPLTAVIHAAWFLSLFRIPSSKLWTKSPFLSCTCIGDPSHQYEHFIVVVHCKRMTKKSCFHVKFMMQNHILVKHEHGTSEWYYPINLPFYQ